MARAANPADLKAKRRAARLKRLFDLTPADYAAILRVQLGACAVCERPPKKLALNVDHCHKTGLVRGGLCGQCNRLLALARDNPDLLNSAAEYLRLPPATLALGGERYGRLGRVTNKAATARRLNRPGRIRKQLANCRRVV